MSDVSNTAPRYFNLGVKGIVLAVLGFVAIFSMHYLQTRSPDFAPIYGAMKWLFAVVALLSTGLGAFFLFAWFTTRKAN